MLISRDRRNEKMLENLAADGITFTKEELCGNNPDTIITRAHIAHALIVKGICSNTDQAFKKISPVRRPLLPAKRASYS